VKAERLVAVGLALSMRILYHDLIYDAVCTYVKRPVGNWLFLRVLAHLASPYMHVVVDVLS
jgi:hypothetical protein